MYVHTGSWPFKCEVCQRGFSKQTNLKNHMHMHQQTEKNKDFSPVLADYLIGLSRQNNNNDEKTGKLDSKESDVIKLFRPINF